MIRKVIKCEHKTQKDEILNQLTISTEDWIESVDLPKVDQNDKAGALQTYSDFFLKLTEYDNLFQRTTGSSRWPVFK